MDIQAKIIDGQVWVRASDAERAWPGHKQEPGWPSKQPIVKCQCKHENNPNISSVHRPGAYTTTEIALSLGISAVALNKFLSDRGWIYKNNGVWVARMSVPTIYYRMAEVKMRWGEINRYIRWTRSGADAVRALWYG